MSDPCARVLLETVRLEETTHGDTATATKPAGGTVCPIDATYDRARREPPPGADDGRDRLDRAGGARPADPSEQAEERSGTSAAPARTHWCAGVPVYEEDDV